MKSATRGFTLIEVVITMALIALLASIAAPLTETVVRRGKEQELKSALYQIRDALDAYKMASDAGHIEKPLSGSGYPRSLNVLVEGVRDLRDVKGGKIYFLRRIPRDPFAATGLDIDEVWGLRAYDSPADDPRAGEDVFDVYSLSELSGLNSIAYSQW